MGDSQAYSLLKDQNDVLDSDAEKARKRKEKGLKTEE